MDKNIIKTLDEIINTLQEISNKCHECSRMNLNYAIDDLNNYIPIWAKAHDFNRGMKSDHEYIF